MDTLARTVGFAAIVFTTVWLVQPNPFTPEPRRTSASISTPYCQGDQLWAGKTMEGSWDKQWIKSWMPCSEVDRYENI